MFLCVLSTVNNAILEIDNVIFTFCLLFLVGYIENLTVNSNVNEKRPQS